MISFRSHRVDHRNNNTPIISDKELDEYAEAVLGDYKPKLLSEAGKIRFEHFLESYLGVNLEFHDIFNEDPQRPIFGATAFNDAYLKIFNREHKCVSKLRVTPNTVIIDNYVMKPGREGLALFTGMHEGGHLLLHPDVYITNSPDQISLLETNQPAPVVCCRQENIESYELHKRIRTPEEWREHQADYFAAAITMPLKTFVPLVWRLLKENNVYKRPIVVGKNDDNDFIALDLLPETISDIYGVSKKAAFIKLRKCGFVIDKRGYEQQESQLVIS